MQSPIKPDFRNSVVNLSAAFAEFLGCENDKPVLADVARALRGGYRNIVLLIFDGLGMYPLEQNASVCGFLRRHIVRPLTSVFPSTTTNATTSLQTAAYPMEHGWFGWSLYFEELRRAVDLFKDVDSFTGEPVERGFVRRRLPVSPFYERAKTDYRIGAVVPPFWEGREEKLVWHTRDEFFAHIAAFCGREGKHFVYAYCTEPDSVMHLFGVSSEEARQTIGALSEGTEKLCAGLRDTLVVIAADHGQIDVSGSFDLYEDVDLCALLDRRPYLEARATAFKVKEGAFSKFEELFGEKYGKYFELRKTETLIAENYFGTGPLEHARLLGDYIAVGTGDQYFRLTPRSGFFKGHHTALTQEMLVPLILIG